MMPRQPAAQFSRIALIAVVIPCLSLLATGCGVSKPKVYRTSGEVFYDGKPAEGATVLFCPIAKGEKSDIKVSPAAIVAADGSFELTTFKSGDGAPAGEYSVLIVWDKTEIEEREERVIEPDKLGYRYARTDVSPLKATVKKTKNRIQRFDLQ